MIKKKYYGDNSRDNNVIKRDDGAVFTGKCDHTIKLNELVVLRCGDSVQG